MRWLAALVTSTLVAAGACSSGDSLVGELTRLRDDACRCDDLACVQAVGDRLVAWAERLGDHKRAGKVGEAASARIETLVAETQTCRRRFAPDPAEFREQARVMEQVLALDAACDECVDRACAARVREGIAAFERDFKPTSDEHAAAVAAGLERIRACAAPERYER